MTANDIEHPIASVKRENHNQNNTEHVNGELKHILSKLEYNDYLLIKERTAKFRQNLIHEIMEQTDKFKEEIEESLMNYNTKKDTKQQQHSNQLKKRDEIQEKVFQHRDSLLTDLFRISHIKTIRHVFIAVLIIILCQNIIYDLTNKGKVDLDFELWQWVFQGFGNVMLFTWLPMQLCGLFVVYYTFKMYSVCRRRVLTMKNTKIEQIYDISWLIIYILYQTMFTIIPLKIVATVNVACRLIILMEQVRLLMKSHAFIRHNLPRVRASLNPNTIDKDEISMELKYYKQNCPKFSKYLYFMFAPTLVYRDEYPRTTSIRWKLVIANFIEVLGCILYTYCLFDRFCVPLFRDLKLRELTFKHYVYYTSLCIMPGALIQLMTFFAFLHAWHNAFAEMLKFGDRQFYLDWWNSTSYNKYYRTWNTLVQDWLHTYIYADLCKLFGHKYRPFSQFLVIFISSIFHEHILSFAFGFFYPIMFVLFAGFGFLCLFIPRGNSSIWNIFIWTTLFSGLGIQLGLFSMEWYARNTNQCPRVTNSIADYFVPRSISCLQS